MSDQQKSKLDEINKRRAAREAAAKAAREARDLADLEALDALEEAHGADKVRKVDTPAAPPLPGLCIIRAPEPAEYKSWQAVTMRAAAKQAEKTAAMEDLARDVLLYPEGDVYEKLCEAHAGLPTLIALEAVRFAGGAADERGKE